MPGRKGRRPGEEQEAGLRAAMDRTAGLTSFDWSGDVSARYSIRGLTMTVGQQTRFQASQAGTADMTALRRDVVSALGAEEETVSFYTGGCYYGEGLWVSHEKPDGSGRGSERHERLFPH